MDFNFHMPVRVISGTDCVIKNASLLRDLGRRAIIVTGKNSAVRSGALADVTTALTSQSIPFLLFDEVTQNPFISTAHRAGQAAAQFGADFVIGIGGGSPLDAAKACAVYAANPDLSPIDIYTQNYKTHPLPLCFVGTTAGTGSEVARFAVLTIDGENRKKSISDDRIYGKIAFCDPKYTYSLPKEFTVSTALDALSHALEGYFNKNAGEVSDLFAIKAISMLYPVIRTLSEDKEISHKSRDILFYGSLYAGITLTHCKTCFPHSLGYILTEEYGIAHGMACAAFLPEFLRRSAEHYSDKLPPLLGKINCSFEELCDGIKQFLTLDSVRMTPQQAQSYGSRFINNPNFANSPGNMNEQDAVNLLTRLFCSDQTNKSLY